MMDELDALKAALKASPLPDPNAKAAALRLAMENFDRLQGSADPARLSQDRRDEAGFLNGVRKMLKTLNTRPYLAATTSVAALCIGFFVVWPQVQHGLPKPTLATDGTAPQITMPALSQTDAEKTKVVVGGTEHTTAMTTPAVPKPVVADEQPGLDATAPVLQADKMEAATLAAPQRADAAVATGQAAAPANTGPAGTSPDAAPATPPATGGIVLDKYASRQGIVVQNSPAMPLQDQIAPRPAPNTEAFATATANPVHVTAEEPVSTFSVDVDTASYTVIRSSLNAGQVPPPEAVRIEEMVNYFPYAYPAPAADGAPFTDTVTVMPTPWNTGTRLVHIALQGRLPAMADRKPLNLVFLIDTSGSMEDANKLPLLKQSFALMLAKLRPEDRVAIVAYAGSAGEVLPPTPASDRAAILNALNALDAGGATAGAEGLLVNASNFTIEDLAIEDAKGDGLKVNEGENIIIRRVRTEWTGGGSTADGFYFSVNGDGGSGDTATGTADYNIYSSITVQTVGTGDYWAGTDATARGNGHLYNTTAFPNSPAAPAAQKTAYPQQTGTLNPGTFGMAWHDVIVSKRGSTVDWVVDGVRFCTISNATFTASNIFIGFWDPFLSLSSNNVINFGLVDNVRVESPAIAPAFITQPFAQTVKLGTNVTFTVTASGLPTPNFQWQLNGTNISTATNASYALAFVAATNAGNYSVTASNFMGVITSTNAALALLAPAAAQFNPGSLNFVGGALQIGFTGDAYWTYTLEVSTNLTGWSTFTNLTSTNGIFNFSTGTTGSPQQFFRARVGP